MVARQILKQKIIVNLVVPALLLLGWIGLIFYQSFQIEKVFTVFTREYPKSAVSVLPNGEIYQGNKIVAEFTATDSHLGIVGFRFWTFYRLNDDYLIFRIREKNSSGWYYQNKYKTDQFQPNQYFTFGFPVIDNSKGKQYVFEIESSEGRPGVAVGVSDVDPVFIAKYKYPRQLVISSAAQFIRFGLNKFVNLLASTEFKVATFIYLMPLLIYLLTLTQFYRSLEKKFRKFLRVRAKFVQQIIGHSGINSGKSVVVVLKNIFHIIITKYYQTDKTANGKIKFIINVIIAWFGVTVFIVIRLSSRYPNILSLVVLTVGSMLDSLFVKTGDVTIVILVILWIYLIYKYKLADKLFFMLALAFLGISATFYYLRFPIASERFGAWAWIFLTIMVGINLIRLKKNRKVPRLII